MAEAGGQVVKVVIPRLVEAGVGKRDGGYVVEGVEEGLGCCEMGCPVWV